MQLAMIKRRILQDWLDARTDPSIVQVHANTRAEGVRLPPEVKKNAVCCLNLSFRFLGRAELTDDGIDVVLSFQETPYHCWLPWGAVSGVTHPAFGAILFPDGAPAGTFFQLAKLEEDGAEPPVEPPPVEPPPEATPTPTNVTPLFGRKKP